MTAASARFLLSVVNSLRPDPGAPDFPEAAAAIIQAQAELKAIVAEDVTEPVE